MGWIEEQTGFKPGKRCHPMWASFRCAHDMPDRPATAHQRIGDQGPVTPPGHRFGAHDGCSQLSAVSRQLINGPPKIL
jgi:hypothetical protein